MKPNVDSCGFFNTFRAFNKHKRSYEVQRTAANVDNIHKINSLLSTI
jgi:hypothetical protein